MRQTCSLILLPTYLYAGVVLHRPRPSICARYVQTWAHSASSTTAFRLWHGTGWAARTHSGLSCSTMEMDPVHHCLLHPYCLRRGGAHRTADTGRPGHLRQLHYCIDTRPRWRVARVVLVQVSAEQWEIQLEPELVSVSVMVKALAWVLV